MAPRSLLLVAMAAPLAHAAITAKLVGVFRTLGNLQDCTLNSIDPNTGVNTTIAHINVCNVTTTSWPAYSALDENNRLLVALATVPNIYAYDVTTAAETVIAPMPADANALLGMVHVNGATYLVSQTNIYVVSNGALKTLTTTALPASAAVAASSAGGANGVGQIFVADEDSNAIYVFDLPGATAAKKLTSGVNGPMDLQVANDTGALIELGSYQLYTTNAASGASRKVMTIPDGPGYPRVNGISPDGATFFFMDFSYVYTIDIASATVTSQQPVDSAPRVIGFPKWVAA